ncbi:Wiskott-Aldrich syndrome protein member 3 [Cichlidogyrus casuarinus]|uniref:Wiskott-Aldrich syndrome protein family member n=1 Tax=Cichlidogyrus casuarinus TaxID=1844966 RepID=A0ABD2PYE4_9PLAT
MPLPKYSVEPVYLSNFHVPNQVESELEYISNGTLCNLMYQMSSICQLSGSMFEELTKELSTITERAARLQQRIQHLSADAQPLKAADEECSLGATGAEIIQFHSKKPTSSQVLNKNTIPMSMRKFYEAAESAPPIHMMDKLRDDGRIGMKMYSDPSFFFDLWSHEMLQAPNKQKKPRKKKPKTKQGKSKTGNNDGPEGGIQIQQQGLGGVVHDEYTRNYNQQPVASNGLHEFSDGYINPAPVAQISDNYCMIPSGFSPNMQHPMAPNNFPASPMPLPPKTGREAFDPSGQQMRMLSTPIDLKMGSVDLPPAPMAMNGTKYTPMEDEVSPSPPPPPMPCSYGLQEDSFNQLAPPSAVDVSIITQAPSRQSMGSSEDLLLPPPPNGMDHMAAASPRPVPASAPAPPAPPPPPPGPSLLPATTIQAKDSAPPVAGPTQDLLSAIRAGMVLRKVSETKPPTMGPGNTGTLSRSRDVQAIFDAVIRRRQMMKQESDSESESEEDSEKSSDWSE